MLPEAFLIRSRVRRLSVSRARATSRAMRKAVLALPVRILLFDVFKSISDLAFRGTLPSQSHLGYRPNSALCTMVECSLLWIRFGAQEACRPVPEPPRLVAWFGGRLSTPSKFFLPAPYVNCITMRLWAQGDNYKGEAESPSAERARAP